MEDGISLAKLAKVKKKDTHGGVKQGSVQYWSQKLLSMYFQNTTFAAFTATNTIHLVTDGSTHGGHETQVTIFFNMPENWACMGTCQTIPPCKVVACHEIDAEDQIKRLLARREAERIGSYRLGHALSKQLALITGDRMNLMTFKPSGNLQLALKPFKKGDARWFSPGMCHVRFNQQDEVIDCELKVNDPRESPPLLVALMDQGPVNMALCAFLASEGFLIHPTWDKIHRLVRDFKLAQEGSKSKCLVKALLGSTYLFSVNYKPFGAGAWYEEKKDLVESFVASESVDS